MTHLDNLLYNGFCDLAHSTLCKPSAGRRVVNAAGRAPVIQFRYIIFLLKLLKCSREYFPYCGPPPKTEHQLGRNGGNFTETPTGSTDKSYCNQSATSLLVQNVEIFMKSAISVELVTRGSHLILLSYRPNLCYPPCKVDMNNIQSPGSIM